MRVEPPASLVDWGVLGTVAVLLTTGVASLFAATPRLAWIYGLHAVAGIGLPVLLFWKLRRVRNRLRPGNWSASTVASVVALVLTLAALATGLYWALGSGFSVGPTTGLTVHAVLGVLVVVPLVVHLAVRFRTPRTDVDAGRRAAVGYSVVAAVGLAGFAARKRVSDALGTVGRFTGSKRVGGEDNEFPETSWVADDPAPVDVSEWTLAVDGAVERRVDYGYDDLAPDDSEEALLDCTSGWYATREWRGVSVGRLLDDAGPAVDAGWVTFESVTGYRWTLPLAEAREALLATHVGGERLTHGHGFPLRLVAPGRRGFQWVKWVQEIEVRTRPDYGQWVAIFTSGFD
jgi:DMSO/TMAO reductase YedYZ molybdopterin-dependent catalytic subunit